MRGEMPSRVADSSWVWGALGLKTVNTRIRKIMNSSNCKRRITPPTMKHLLLALGPRPWSLVSVIDAYRVWLVIEILKEDKGHIGNPQSYKYRPQTVQVGRRRYKCMDVPATKQSVGGWRLLIISHHHRPRVPDNLFFSHFYEWKNLFGLYLPPLTSTKYWS